MDELQLSNLSHIHQAYRNNRLVIFVGAGVSRNSGVPTWDELIAAMKSELPTDLRFENDALKIAQLYKDARGYKEYMDKVKDILLYNKTTPNPLHKRILSLNPSHIVTTNYDDLIEQEIQNEYIQYTIIREDKDIPQMAYPNSLIKMHGDYVTNNIVLTETDYYNYKNNFPLVRAFVQSLFASKLVLFVGFSFADLNLKIILEELKGILSDHMQRAYLLSCDEPNHVVRNYFENKGVNVVYFSENEIDLINGSDYSITSLNGKGLLMDKVLFAIQNYSNTSKKDIASYVYNRIKSYYKEMRSFGDGLKYFFPNYSSMTWHTHSSGVQTFLPDFTELEKTTKDDQGKRRFLHKHPDIDLSTLLKLAYYNYLTEIDGIKILDDRFKNNISKYIPKTTIDYLRQFDFSSMENRILQLRSTALQYTIDDLEYPFTLYLLGDYAGAIKQYAKLLPMYWNRQKYILYFICRYNMWSIRYNAQWQKHWDVITDIEQDLQLALDTDLEDILNKLPFDWEIKKIFQDLISYRSIGGRLVKTERLREEIYKQKKITEKGGCSINSNILLLLGAYQREYLFCTANHIICNNSGYFKSLCYNTASGILNSFSTPESSMFGGLLVSTKVDSLDQSMLKILIFDIDKKNLESILKGYDIETLKFDDSGIEYINLCLQGLADSNRSLYKSNDAFYPSLCNILLLISKSHTDAINNELLYKVLLKYWNYEFHIGHGVIENIISRFELPQSYVNELISKMLYATHSSLNYTGCIEKLISRTTEFTDIRMDSFKEHEAIRNLLVIYPACPDVQKPMLLTYCLDNIEDFWCYIRFIFHNHIIQQSDARIKELYNKYNKNLDEHDCYILAKIKNDLAFAALHSFIDEIAISNECLKFFLSPKEYKDFDNVNVEWIFKFSQEEREEFFKNEVYKTKLKEYINSHWLSKSDMKYLISLL